MVGPNSTAKTGLANNPLRLHKLAYADFVGDPVRITDAPKPVVPSGTGDTLLDGFTFDNFDHTLMEISSSDKGENGSGPLEVTLSGLVGIDTDLLNIIGDVTKWKGRLAAFYFILLDESFTQVGNIWSFHTGRMVNAYFSGSPDNVKVTVIIENYLASLFEPSGRTYLDQATFDPGDLSAGAITGGLNTGSPLTGGNNGGFGQGGGGGGGFRTPYNLRNV